MPRYAIEWAVPSTVLRLFSVYGPGQRSDMALHRICEAALGGPAFTLLGTGLCRRDLTYVDDVVAAIVTAGLNPLEPATVLNIAGGRAVSVAELIEMVELVGGRPVPVVVERAAPGDVSVTRGDSARAHRLLGWAPLTTLEEGVACELAWHRSRAPATIPG